MHGMEPGSQGHDEGETRLPDDPMNWYTPDIESISEEGRSLLEEYSGIPPDEVLPHVRAIRDAAWKVHTYPCIGQVKFLNNTLLSYPYGPTVLSRLRSSTDTTYLDVGCGLGQEIRYLIHTENILATQLYAFDYSPAFVELSFDLFRDRERLIEGNLTAGDLLVDPNEQPGIKNFIGKMDIVNASQLLAVWDWEDQFVAAKNLVAFTRPRPGSLIVGNHMGSVNPGSYAMPTKKGKNYRHDVQSFENFWKEVGEGTGTEWTVKAGLVGSPAIEQNRAQSWMDPGMRMLWFWCERV